jgi:hypothetical protein
MNVELSYPWGMTWIDSTNLLITEKKSKEIILLILKIILQKKLNIKYL